jgi:hypothetical protein
MKAKTMFKKLTLNKKTVSNLDNLEQRNVKGGTIPTVLPPCLSFPPKNCPTFDDAESCLHGQCLP